MAEFASSHELEKARTSGYRAAIATGSVWCSPRNQEFAMRQVENGTSTATLDPQGHGFLGDPERACAVAESLESEQLATLESNTPYLRRAFIRWSESGWMFDDAALDRCEPYRDVVRVDGAGYWELWVRDSLGVCWGDELLRFANGAAESPVESVLDDANHARGIRMSVIYICSGPDGLYDPARMATGCQIRSQDEWTRWCARYHDAYLDGDLAFDGIFVFPNTPTPRCYPGVFDPPETLDYPGLEEFFEDGEPPWGQPRDVYDFDAIREAVEAYEAGIDPPSPDPGTTPNDVSLEGGTP